MKKLMTLMLGMSLLFGSVVAISGQEPADKKSKTTTQRKTASKKKAETPKKGGGGSL
jgi:hypothetical protein